MQRETTSEFAKKFGQYREIVQREPIAVISHDRVTSCFISAIEYEEFSCLKSMMPKAYAVEELDDDTLNAIMASEMDARHNHVNELPDE